MLIRRGSGSVAFFLCDTDIPNYVGNAKRTFTLTKSQWEGYRVWTCTPSLRSSEG